MTGWLQPKNPQKITSRLKKKIGYETQLIAPRRKKSRANGWLEELLPDLAFKNLSRWLEVRGLFSKDDVARSIESGDLHWTKIIGVGRKSYIRLCVELGVQPLSVTNDLKAAKLGKAEDLLQQHGYTVIKPKQEK